MYPVGKNAVLHTPFAEVCLERGRLEARDRDYIDAIMCCMEKEPILSSTGEMAIVFDSRKIMKMLGYSTQTKWGDIPLYNRLVDLQTVIFAVRRPGEAWPERTFSIISTIGNTGTKASRRPGQFQSPLRKVVFTAGFVQLLLHDTQLYASPDLVRQILGLKHQIGRSISRWCLSHSTDQHHDIDNVLEYVGATPCDSRIKRRYLQQLDEDAAGMKRIGINFVREKRKIHYTRNKNIFIQVMNLAAGDVVEDKNTPVK